MKSPHHTKNMFPHQRTLTCSFCIIWKCVLTFTYECICVCMHVCIQTYVPISVWRSETACISPFSPFSSWVSGSNSGHQSWWQAPYPLTHSQAWKYISNDRVRDQKRINELNLQGKQNYCNSRSKNPHRVMLISYFMLETAMLEIWLRLSKRKVLYRKNVTESEESQGSLQKVSLVKQLRAKILDSDFPWFQIRSLFTFRNLNSLAFETGRRAQSPDCCDKSLAWLVWRSRTVPRTGQPLTDGRF